MRSRTCETTCLTLLLAVVLTGCPQHGSEQTLDTAQSEALVRAEASKALAAVVAALPATGLKAGGEWMSCGGYPAWKYGGWAMFTGPEGDRQQQLEAVRAALLKVGFTARQDGNRVLATSDGFSFVVGPLLYAAPKWKADFQVSQCSRHTPQERNYIEGRQGRADPIEL